MLGVGLGLTQPRNRGAAFSPLDIPDLVGWWDASVASSITLNGSDVSQWDDISGNGKVASQATASLQPLYSSTELLGGIRIASSADTERLATNLLFNGDPVTFFGVFRRNGSTGNGFGNLNQWLIGVGGFSTYVGFWSDTGWGAQVRDNAGGNTVVYEVALDTDLHVARFEGLSTSLSLQLDLNAAVTTAHTRNTTQLTRNVSFGSESSAFRADTWLHELLFYDRQLDASQTLSVQNYLISKWGV